MKFAVAINCIDGRVQLPVIEWLKENYRVDFVDIVTEPAPDLILSTIEDDVKIESIRSRVELSIKKHDTRIVAVVGHHDCAGNPVDEKKHIKHISGAIKIVESWGYNVKVIGLWVDAEWTIKIINSLRSEF